MWGVSCLQVGDAVPLLHWQATRGFAHVPEGIVKRLLSEYFKVDAIATPFLEQSPDAEAAATLLAISCVAPKLTATDAERILYQKTELEGGEDPTGVQAMMDEEVLTECMVARDVAQTKDWLANAIKKHAAKHDQKKHVAPISHAFFKDKINAKVAAKNLKSTMGALKKSLGPKVVAKARWAAAVLAGDASVLQEAKPPAATITADDFNGCFRIYYGGRRQKSISWTIRGAPKAIALTLRTAWAIHHDWTGEEITLQAFLDGLDAEG